MRLLRILLVVLSLAFGIAVAALNSSSVRLDLLLIELHLPLGLLLLAVLLIGALLGGTAAFLSRWIAASTRDPKASGTDPLP